VSIDVGIGLQGRPTTRRSPTPLCLCVSVANLLCVLFVLFVLGVSGAEGAVDDFLGKPVASVQLIIEGRETVDPSLARVIETHVGEPLAMPAVRDTITHLFSLGRFDDVRVDATVVEADRVALRYELSPIHPVTRIAFEGGMGGDGVDASRLRRAVIDRYGLSPPLGRATEAARVVADVLRESGYLHADIKPRVDVTHQPEQATLVFRVDPGPRTVVDSIDIVGTPTVSQGDLLRRLDLARGVAYQREALDARIDRYVADRRKAGYYEAKLTLTAALTDGDRLANLTLTVTPGPHVRVVFAGDLLPADKRAELVPIEREGSVDEDLLEDATNAIVEYLRGQGYRDAMAPHSRTESGSELLIVFDVKRGPEYRVDRIEISGNASVPLSEFEPVLRLRDGEPFAEARLDADLATIQELYRRRGFAAAKVQSAEERQRMEPRATFVPLRVRTVITEGVRTLVSAVRIQGAEALSEAELKEGLGLQPGRPYVDTQLAIDREAIQQRYLDLGYQNVTVDANPNFSADRTLAEPIFIVREGPRIFVDHVLIVGNVRTGLATIERELQLKQGEALSEAAKIESRRRLAALGLFRRVQIAELAHGDEARRDLLVTVEEGPVTTVIVGGGAEGRLRPVRSAEGGIVSEQFDLAPRGSFQFTRRNLFGKNRSVSVFASVSLSLKDSQVFGDLGTPTISRKFPEYRVLGTYREPRLFNTVADAFITGTIEQRIRSSFNFSRSIGGAGYARRISSATSFTGAYQIQRTRVFDSQVPPEDEPLIDRTFSRYRLSSFSAAMLRDTRNDSADPTSGGYLSANGEVAGLAIGSEAGFVKSYFTAQTFRLVTHTTGVLFAGSARLGLGFPREAVRKDEQGRNELGADGRAIIEPVDDLPASERFFAGGDTTVRGFALDRLGTADTIKDGSPLGGSAVVIFNGELRVSVPGNAQIVGFVDSGNVFKHVGDFDLGELRAAVGFGGRYRSPVGPIRVDVGFKVHREPGEGAMAFHISLGQAF
jgi:outer membrane protein assembly complex protein YaeT